MDLGDGKTQLTLGARVLRVEERDEGGSDVAVRFLDLCDPDRRQIEHCLAEPEAAADGEPA